MAIEIEEKMGIKIQSNPPESKLTQLGVRTWPKGKVKVYPDGHNEFVEFGAGDLVEFPKGMSCTWDVSETVDKHYNFDIDVDTARALVAEVVVGTHIDVASAKDTHRDVDVDVVVQVDTTLAQVDAAVVTNDSQNILIGEQACAPMNQQTRYKVQPISLPSTRSRVQKETQADEELMDYG
ncbi:hypothetical protein IFM89_037142 [Coptis chinensis]|uniref:(S)-ureidoglycine aminohydrolase cupin domain-containing protein n=1 Tax=Coptis chinensis TaxID=261450 RepID=A0A835HQI0_9MAGN|nr:hypothetical protein IFM89_037142 [Coptis chinensis]